VVPATAIGTYRASLLGSFGTLKAIRSATSPNTPPAIPAIVASASRPSTCGAQSTQRCADRHASVRRGIALAGYVHCDDGEDDRQTEQRRAEYAHNDGDQTR